MAHTYIIEVSSTKPSQAHSKDFQFSVTPDPKTNLGIVKVSWSSKTFLALFEDKNLASEVGQALVDGDQAFRVKGARPWHKKQGFVVSEVTELVRGAACPA